MLGGVTLKFVAPERRSCLISLPRRTRHLGNYWVSIGVCLLHDVIQSVSRDVEREFIQPVDRVFCSLFVVWRTIVDARTVARQDGIDEGIAGKTSLLEMSEVLHLANSTLKE